MVHRFPEPATSRVVGWDLATSRGYYVTPGNVARIHRGAPGVNVGGENRGDGESRKVGDEGMVRGARREEGALCTVGKMRAPIPTQGTRIRRRTDAYGGIGHVCKRRTHVCGDGRTDLYTETRYMYYCTARCIQRKLTYTDTVCMQILYSACTGHTYTAI